MDYKSTSDIPKSGEYIRRVGPQKKIWISCTIFTQNPQTLKCFSHNIVNMRTKFQRIVLLNPKISRGMEIFDDMSV